MYRLINGLVPMGCIYGAYALSYLANMVLGVCYNCLIHGERFDIMRIFKSFLKLLVVAIVTACVVVGFNLLQMGAQMFGLDITDSVTNVVSIASFLALFAGGFVSVVQDVYEKIKAIFEISTALKMDEIEFPKDWGGIG